MNSVERLHEMTMTRELAARADAVSEEERTAELTFSSEKPYKRWFGLEILDHSENSVDLTRLQEIGVLLFNHEPDHPIGEWKRCGSETILVGMPWLNLMLMKNLTGFLKRYPEVLSAGCRSDTVSMNTPSSRKGKPVRTVGSKGPQSLSISGSRWKSVLYRYPPMPESVSGGLLKI